MASFVIFGVAMVSTGLTMIASIPWGDEVLYLTELLSDIPLGRPRIGYPLLAPLPFPS